MMRQKVSVFDTWTVYSSPWGSTLTTPTATNSNVVTIRDERYRRETDRLYVPVAEVQVYSPEEVRPVRPRARWLFQLWASLQIEGERPVRRPKVPASRPAKARARYGLSRPPSLHCRRAGRGEREMG